MIYNGVTKYDVVMSVFVIIDTSLINLWSCLLSSLFSWGQAESKLGRVDTSILHHYFLV